LAFVLKNASPKLFAGIVVCAVNLSPLSVTPVIVTFALIAPRLRSATFVSAPTVCGKPTSKFKSVGWSNQ
jgi:hypothetical protein